MGSWRVISPSKFPSLNRTDMKRKIAVLGGGISGYGSAILAKKKGFDVFLSDMGKIADRFKQRLEEWSVEYEEGQHTEERILDANEVVKSPGIPDTAPIVCKIRERVRRRTG